MKTYYYIIFGIIVECATSSAIPKLQRENKVYDRPLSDVDHMPDDIHNVQYDHEAFLGKEDARDFENLSPEESKDRLGKIFEKIDKDKDGFVTEAELRNWIRHIQTRFVSKETENQWRDFKNDLKDDLLSFEDYKKRTYGPGSDPEDEEDGANKLIKRDERRWQKADLNNDNLLNKDEFLNFLHPEESDHMRDVVVDETIEDIDRNGDGKIDIEEFIRDLWREEDSDEEKQEPEWIQEERDQFKSFRDKNHDGFMDREEVRDWIIPEDYDHSESEAKHLLQEADVDKNEKLSKEEVLEKFDLFVGSQATDFGEALSRHDEF